MTVRRGGAALAALCLASMLAACQTGGENASLSANTTNAPAAGFENLTAGSEEDFMLNVGRRTYFAAGSASLDGVAVVTLDKQAEWLRSNIGWKVKIQGFADDPGSDAANVELSRKRAQAVHDYLVSKGVSRDRMWIKGYGNDRKVRDCADIQCKAQNRRVITNLRDEFET